MVASLGGKASRLVLLLRSTGPAALRGRSDALRCPRESSGRFRLSAMVSLGTFESQSPVTVCNRYLTPAAARTTVTGCTTKPDEHSPVTAAKRTGLREQARPQPALLSEAAFVRVV